MGSAGDYRPYGASASLPRALVAYFLLAATAALCACTRTIRTDAVSSNAAKQERGYELEKAGRYAEAIREFSEILLDEPGNQAARVELAYLHARLRHWREAVRYFASAQDAEPTNMRLRMDLAYARQALGELEAAADDFRIVLREPNEFHDQAEQALKGVLAISADAARHIDGETMLNDGYDALRRGETWAAKDRFKMALLQEPQRAEVHKQLGYLSAKEGNLPSAIKSFEGARRLEPTDYVTSLELGYMYDAIHNERKAVEAFTAALASPDTSIRNAAREAISTLQSRRSRLYLDLYGGPYYTSRFSNGIAYFEAQLGYHPNPDSPLSFYVGSRYTQDSRSHAGTEPQIYSDNLFSLGPGLRVQPPGFNASLSFEYNVAFNLTKTPDHSGTAEGDRRVNLADYHYWNSFRGPIGLLTLGSLDTDRAFTDVGLNIGYYSRYHDNVIGLLQFREGVKIVDDGVSLVSAYLPATVARDVNHDFFNNLFEFGAGVESQPLIRYSVKLRAEYFRGVYFGIQGRDPNPYGPNYHDFRVTLLFTKRFSIQGPPAEKAARPDYVEERGTGSVRWRSYLW